MGEPDPHIHIDAKLGADGAARNLLASAFGLAADAPTVVGTGCGQQVPYAMTALRPESVTCLPCREFARRQHLRLADQVEDLGRAPGSPFSPEQAVSAARQYRDLARRFADPAG